MDKFRIFETEGFALDLESDFSGQKEKIIEKLLTYAYPQLREQPFYGKNIKKLINYEPDTWRYRIGNYRFFYEIDKIKNLVIMISADNRSDAYRIR